MTAAKKSPPQAVFKTKTKAEKVADALVQALKDAATGKQGSKSGKPAPRASGKAPVKAPAKSVAKPSAKPVQPRAEVQPDLEAMLQGLLKSTPKMAEPGTEGAGQRCGLVAIVGKPNVGKSTLLNALVGQKISITSRKAQTTRHRITGMRTQGATQFVFVDTPGFQTIHGNALNKSLNKAVQGAVSDVDLILLVVEAGSFTPADARVLSLLGKDIPTILVANKLDNVHRRGDIAPWLQEMQAKHPFAEFMPMSAKNPKDVERLLAVCEGFLPEQAWWYAEDELTDRSDKFLASELVREKLFRLTGDELPYTSTVVIDKFEEEPPQKKGQKRLLRIAATIVVERDGHKAMVIGDKGERIKRIGMETRVELEKLADAKVFLELWVKVRSGWADDEARVRSFGYE